MELPDTLVHLVKPREHSDFQGVLRRGPIGMPGSAGSVQQKRGHKNHEQMGCRGLTERLGEG